MKMGIDTTVDSQIWKIIVRIMMTVIFPSAMALLVWWIKSVSVQAIETKQEVAVLQSQYSNIRESLGDIKGMLKDHMNERRR